MRLGIHTRYLADDSLQLAVRIAEWARTAGHEVSLFSSTRPLRPLLPAWDQHVRSTQRLQFAAWAKSRDVILWTCRPEMVELRWAARCKIPRLAMLLWHELRPADRMTYTKLEALAAPSYAAAAALGEAWNTRIHGVTWDVGVPFTSKPESSVDAARLLLPLLDDAPYRTDGTSLGMISAVLEMTTASLTVAYNSASMVGFAMRELRRWLKRFPGRISLCRGVALADRPLLFAAHDLTIWPTRFESLGVPGLLSISMGTPVVAFAIKPLTEFLSSLNSTLVCCGQERGPLQAPRADPDYDAMAEAIIGQVAHPRRLADQQRRVLHGLQTRTALFSSGMEEFFAPYC